MTNFEKFVERYKKLSKIRGIKRKDGTFKRLFPRYKDDTHEYISWIYKKDEKGNIQNKWQVSYLTNNYKELVEHWA